MTKDQKSASNQVADAQLLHKLPTIAGFLAIALIVSYAAVFRALPFNQNPSAWGSFGDFVGGLLNPLISLFTLVVAVSVWKLQKTELEETRAAVKDQGKTAEQQRREQRFFDFLNIYRATVDSIEFEAPTKTGSPLVFKGKRAFKHLTSLHGYKPLTYIAELFEEGHWGKWSATEKIPLAQLHWNEQSPILDHYFRVVFTLLREAEPTLKEDCWRYMKLLRAQLSRDEINLIAMNLLFDAEGEKMRPLAARYGLLKHMPRNTLRELTERDLSPASFGRAWEQQHAACTVE